MADPKTPSPRPLSPHIQIYRWPVTMVMSILNRITGAALYVGTVLLAAWLMAAASGPEAFARAQWLAGSPIGLLVLFGYTWALMHHMLGGLRHFVWDLGFGHGAVERIWLSYATIVGSVVLTLAIWVFAFLVGG
jgi:succinate dehydrogenase / fumarate reductase cytochrome b subunit